MAANNASIQILRSYANSAPNNLLDGQLAYSFLSNTLFIGSNTANGNLVITIGGQSVVSTLNTVFGLVNNVIIVANSAYKQANIATTDSNNALTIANSAYAQANIATTDSNNALTIANSAYRQANVATTDSNNALTIANSAYRQANVATTDSNNALTIANAAYRQANVATTDSNNALTIANAAYRQANVATTIANSAYAQANSASANANIAFTTANAAYRQANIATSNADAAFALANNILSGNVAFANLSINIGGSIFFGTNTYTQSNRSAIFVTNEMLNVNPDLINNLLPGDYYYDDLNDSIYIYVDYTTYFDFKDLTVRV